MTEETERLSISSVTHNGLSYPQVLEPRCLTCNHESRVLIENLAVKGTRSSSIVRMLGEDANGLSARNIADHMSNGHARMPNTLVVSRMIDKAQDANVSLEDLEESYRKEVFAAELVVDKFRARLADEDFQPDFKDGLAAIKLLGELTRDEQEGAFGPNETFVALSTFLSHTRTVLTRYIPSESEEAMSALGNLLEQDPILRQLISRTKVEQTASMLDEPDDDDSYYVDAEVEEVVGSVPTETFLFSDEPDDEPFDEPDDED